MSVEGELLIRGFIDPEDRLRERDEHNVQTRAHPLRHFCTLHCAELI